MIKFTGPSYPFGQLTITLGEYLRLRDRVKALEEERDYLLDMILEEPLYLREYDDISLDMTWAKRDEIREKYPEQFQAAYEEAKRKDEELFKRADELSKMKLKDAPF